jgi:hypothetical protein
MVKSPETQRPRAPSPNDDRRKHHRVDAPLKARYLDAAGDEQPCLVMNVSAGGALLRAKTTPPFGSHVVIYIDRLGRFEGRVIRSGEKSFAVNYEKKRKKNAKTADALTQVVNQSKRSHDRRASPRIMHDAPAKVFFDDGRSEDCAILDISLTGASIEISPRPPLGTRLILGRMNAKVVRRHDKGVGVVFTGASKRMDDVIKDAAQSSRNTVDAPQPIDGAGVAKPFGKKF